MKNKFIAWHFNKYIDFIKALGEEPANQEQILLRTYAIAKEISVDSLFSLEQFEAMHLINKKYYKFIVRYDNKINNSLKIRYKEQHFRIMKIINFEEQDRYLIIYGEELAHE